LSKYHSSFYLDPKVTNIKVTKVYLKPPRLTSQRRDKSLACIYVALFATFHCRFVGSTWVTYNLKTFVTLANHNVIVFCERERNYSLCASIALLCERENCFSVEILGRLMWWEAIKPLDFNDRFLKFHLAVCLALNVRSNFSFELWI